MKKSESVHRWGGGLIGVFSKFRKFFVQPRGGSGLFVHYSHYVTFYIQYIILIYDISYTLYKNIYHATKTEPKNNGFY